MYKFTKKTIKDIPLDGKTVLVRVDYNVPLNSDGTISSDYRISCSLPTIKYLSTKNCRVIICSHLGRPNGKKSESLSLAPIAIRLSELLGKKVAFVDDCIGDKVKQAVKTIGPGGVLLLENLRFYQGEEDNDQSFASKLKSSTSADYFVQDGFGVVHREHASTSAITHLLPSVAGLLVEKETTTIKAAIESPEKPLLAIIGGAKIADKLPLIKKFISIANQVVITGAIANNFLRYKGYRVGKSLIETGVTDDIKEIYRLAAAKVGATAVDKFLWLPVDVAVGKRRDLNEPRRDVSLNDIESDDIILDVGPRSINHLSTAVMLAKTVIWNGTLGYAEAEQFSYGSARLALQLAQQKDKTASIIGGGDTADFIMGWDAMNGESFTHISSGGGAGLELMAGLPMPGIDSLLDA